MLLLQHQLDATGAGDTPAGEEPPPPDASRTEARVAGVRVRFSPGMLPPKQRYRGISDGYLLWLIAELRRSGAVRCALLAVAQNKKQKKSVPFLLIFW